MNPAIRVGLFGFGKAGRKVSEQFLSDPAIDLRWVVRGTRTLSGSHLSAGVPIHCAQDIDLDGLLNDAAVDFVVDFSTADTCLGYAHIVSERGCGIISAVSSYKNNHLQCLRKASEKTVVLYSPNITLGINFIIIAGKILRKLAPHAGVEVIEEHFHGKKEVSGTAVRIAELLGLDSARQVKSVRVGGIVGRHEVIFGFPYQTVRLVHDSISRAAFGQGALYAIKKLHGRPKGFYTMEQLVAEGFSAALA